jgi:hypothetical protein
LIEENTNQEKILKIIKKENPQTTEDLVKQSVQQLNISEETALQHIIELENDRRLKLTYPVKETPAYIMDYISSTQAIWFWIIIILAIATTITVFTIPERAYPLVYVRYILGSLFVLFLPGYSLIKTLFPTREIDDIERIALSIGTSLAVVPLVGLLLNYTTWGIRLTPITLSILLLTVILATTGVIREYQEKLSIQIASG